MGQYYMVVNMDRGEYLHPHEFHGGLKAMEIAGSKHFGPLMSYLLTASTGSGGGDWRTGDMETEYLGRWAGEAIAVAGDYDESGLGLTREEKEAADAYLEHPYEEREEMDFEQGFVTLYSKAQMRYDNITESLIEEFNAVVGEDSYLAIEEPVWLREGQQFTVVGVHPNHPETLATDVDWHEARQTGRTYKDAHGGGYVKVFTQTDDGLEAV